MRHTSVDLCGTWKFVITEEIFRTLDELRKSDLEILEGTVPGNFELDLQENGEIDDPFRGLNILDIREYEYCHLYMWRSFGADEDDNRDAFLVFEGIDCISEVFLNSEKVGETDNMLIDHTFNVTGKLTDDNELFIHIIPVMEKAKEYSYPPGVTAAQASFPSLYIRKAPHMFGWDIMPRALSGGLWRPARLEYRPEERIDRVFCETCSITSDRTSATLRLYYRMNLGNTVDNEYRIRISGDSEGAQFSEEAPVIFDAGFCTIPVECPMLWWPRGRGDQNLYTITVQLFKNGRVIDEKKFRHGIRTVRFIHTGVTDKEGRGTFHFEVNGEKIFCRGTNWVPLDAFHSRDIKRVDRAMEMIKDLDCNMILCWGGNVYESDRFFDLCDEYGIMVMQDFAMACGIYPQDREFQERLETEARAVIRRLRNHPSLVLWIGDNENDAAHSWHHRGDPNNNILTRKLLPGILREEDPTRGYLPSSPWISDEAYIEGTEYLPEEHLWGPRNYYKGPFYSESLCHFVSEIGYHGCPSPGSMKKFLSEEKLWPWRNNKEWELHSTNAIPGVSPDAYRVELMAKQIEYVFGEVPGNLEEYAFASQAVQAEAKKFFIELFRTWKWRKTGILWWNLLDGWPQLSDAVVDYFFTKKLAYSYIKRAQNIFSLAVREPRGKAQTVVACNDTGEDIRFAYTLREIETGKPVAEGAGLAEADAVTELKQIPYVDKMHRFYLIEWDTDMGEKGVNHYLAGVPPFTLETYRRWITKAGFLDDEPDYGWMKNKSDQ